jgi:hypothetical protein
MREVELGLFDCKPILWVDDEIFNKEWENKDLMEDATKLSQNIRFICKPSTTLAIKFLDSIFGKQLVENKQLRIISDMRRKKVNSGALFMNIL